MSDKPDKDTEAKPKKGKGMMMKLLLGLGLIGAGGGGVFGMVQAGMLGGGHGPAKKEDNHPKLIKKGEEDPYAPKAEGGKEGEGAGGPEVEAKAAVSIAPPITTSPRISPPTSPIRRGWSRSASPLRPAATGGCCCG